MKRVSVYPAAETVQVSLRGVADTDYIRIVWTDANQIPLASPTMLRMSKNGAAAYTQFAQALAALETPDVEPAAVIENPYLMARLLVSCSELPDLSKYGEVTTIAAPDNLYVLQFEDPDKAKQCEKDLQLLPSVRYVEPDGVLQADSDGTPILLDGSNPLPDPLSWGVKDTGIGAYAESLRKQGVTRSVTVAVVDSGVDMNHPFLKERLINGYNFVEGDKVPQDKHYHGTHVAGTIVDCTPGMDVKIMPVRVLNAFANGLSSNIANGIRFAADNGANVINLSLGHSTDRHSNTIDEAVDYALSKNVTVVTVSGNYNGDAKNYCPAHMENCITVAAVDSSLKRFERSNYGTVVDIAAPGVDIKSCYLDGKYGTESGTSMAAPHVSAAAALLMCELGTENGSEKTPDEISELLKNAATPIPKDVDDWDWKRYEEQNGNASFLGAGFLNMRPFVKYTVTFVGNGGTGNMDALRVSNGESVTLTPNGFKRTGYTLQGWNTKSDGSGKSYAVGASLTVTADMTLYAQWKQAEWTVTLHANDGSGQTKTVTVSAEKPFAWPENLFSRTGYTLTGWNTKSDGSGKSYAVGASLTVNADMTLYAQWKQDTPADPVPAKPISWGTTATHMDEYAASLQKRGLSKQVIVAEIGSGVDASHPFLEGRLVPGYDFIEYDDTPQDEHGHGTHVAGIIADCTPDNVKIMPVRVLNAYGTGQSNAIVNGIDYAVAHGANVICLPLVVSSHRGSIEDAVNRALSKGITVVVPAGNYNGNAKNCCPAHMEDCITVAAVDQNLKREERSNYGEVVDIAAPGVDINSCLPNGKYGEMTGTSMCTAYVSAAAAMLMCEYGTDQTPDKIAERLKNAAMPIPEDSEDTEWQNYKEAGHSWSEFLGAGFLDMRPFTAKASTLSWGTTATHMDKYAESLQKRGFSKQVIVAELDSGVDASHPFLEGRLVPGYDFIEYDDTPQDEHGHSTHMAGIIADCTPDNVKIMPVRVLNAFAGGSYLNIGLGIRYAVDHGANVICLPLRSNSNNAMMENAVNYALSAGITVVVAAGNNNWNAQDTYPANVAECITVAAVDQNLKRFELSNYGEVVDIAAPGVDINSCFLNDQYCEMTGTSMCTAYVAGAAAMLMCEYGTDQTPDKIAERLKNAAMPIPEDSEDTAWKNYQKDGHSWSEFLGAGFLDMSAFVSTPAYAMLYEDGEILFQKSNVPASGRKTIGVYQLPTDASGQYSGWYSVRDKIKTVTFSEKIQPASTSLWFYDCKNLTEIRGLENLDTSRVTDMSQMFARCTSLKTLDLSACDTQNVTNMRQMFFMCTALNTVYTSDKFRVSNVTDSVDMFTDCTALVGGNGTKFDSGHIDKTYARIDTASAPGYFTRKA